MQTYATFARLKTSLWTKSGKHLSMKNGDNNTENRISKASKGSPLLIYAPSFPSKRIRFLRMWKEYTKIPRHLIFCFRDAEKRIYTKPINTCKLIA